MRQLREKIQSHLRNAIRCSIATGRFAEELNRHISQATGIDQDLVHMMFFLDAGKQSTMVGMGRMYEEFLKSGKLEGYSGFGTRPAEFNEEHYDEAPLRIMTFSNTYGNVMSEVAKRTKIL